MIKPRPDKVLIPIDFKYTRFFYDLLYTNEIFNKDNFKFISRYLSIDIVEIPVNRVDKLVEAIGDR